jgi:hypothetical protein
VDQDAIRLLATISALKLLVGRLFTLVYIDAKLTPEQISALHETMLENLPKQSLMKIDDPALSDLLSSEVEAEIKTFLQGVESEVARVGRMP